MHSHLLVILCIGFLYQSVSGIYFRNFPREPESKPYNFEDTSEEIQNFTSDILNDSSVISNNASKYRIDDQHLESTSVTLVNEILKTVESSSSSSLSVLSIESLPSTHSTRTETAVTEIFSNGSNSTTSLPQFSGNPSNSTEQTKSGTKTTSTKEGIIISSTEDEEQEEVIRGKPSSTESTSTITSKTDSIYQKALTLISDTYTLSILIPVAAGVVFASTIIITIATCRCLRRQCRRRRLRKKALPDSVKNLRPSDRARLLAESSDEEF